MSAPSLGQLRRAYNIAVDPASVNLVVAYCASMCPPPAPSPCLAGTTSTAVCAPPQRLGCTTFIPSMGGQSVVGAACPPAASGLLGCLYPCPRPLTAVASGVFVAGKTTTVAIDLPSLAAGNIAAYGCCGPSPSSLAPHGPTADTSFIL